MPLYARRSELLNLDYFAPNIAEDPALTKKRKWIQDGVSLGTLTQADADKQIAALEKATEAPKPTPASLDRFKQITALVEELSPIINALRAAQIEEFAELAMDGEIDVSSEEALTELTKRDVAQLVKWLNEPARKGAESTGVPRDGMPDDVYKAIKGFADAKSKKAKA